MRRPPSRWNGWTTPWNCAQPSPDEAAWRRARERAAALFELAPGEVCKGATVARLAAELRERACGLRGVSASAAELRGRMGGFGVVADEVPRMITLLSAGSLVGALVSGTGPLDTVAALAEADGRGGGGPRAAAGGGAAGGLQGVAWTALAAAAGLSDHRAAAGAALRARVAEALRADEHAVPLLAALRTERDEALRLLAEAARSTAPPTPAPSPPRGGGDPTPLARRWRARRRAV